MDKKYSAYLCTGCGIGDAIDIEALSGVVSSEMGMECKSHQALCSAEGRALIEADINDNGVNTVVIGACSPRVMQDEFNFGDDKITIRANLREQVAWSNPADADKEYVQEQASDYMRMACTQAKKTDLPDPFQLETVNKRIKAALKHGLTPIVCVGEVLKEREENKTFDVIQKQCAGGCAICR